MKREKIQVVGTTTAGNNNTTRGRTGLMMGADITALRADGEAHTSYYKHQQMTGRADTSSRVRWGLVPLSRSMSKTRLADDIALSCSGMFAIVVR